MIKIATGVGVAAALVLAGATVQAQIPAFPGAEGFGAYASGGRGGDVYTVTSLNNSGAGTLREALDTAPAGGRTIVFAVSGYIPVVSDTNFQVPANVTIAGQTAPGDGVGLKGGRMLISGNNTIMRHFRIRHGKYGTGGDCLNIASGVDTTMIDHISMMFSTDENFSFFGGYPDDFTMQYSSTSWGMERHNAGGLWDLQDGTCHHSLWAHHRTRNPKARPAGLLEWINNVTFHWRNEGFIMGDSETPADWKANVQGCYYISIDDADDGSTVNSTAFNKATVSSDGIPNFSLYLDDTLFDNNTNGVVDGTDLGYGIVQGSEFAPGDPVGANRYYKSATPFGGATEPVAIDDPLTAYKKVVSSVGPLRLDAGASSLRDELDGLLIDTVTNQYSILVQKDGWVEGEDPTRTSNGEQLLADQYGISNNGFGTLNYSTAPTDTDGDGMPDYWENALGWNALVQNHNTAMPNSGGYLTGLSFFPTNTPAGYTQLEEYLHFKAIPHASIAANSVLEVDLRRYTDGFADSPVFTFSNVTNGTAVLHPDGYTVHFTPATDFAGRCRFDFTVTDADGSTWTQTFGVLASFAFVPPAAPSGLSATAVSSHQIDLSWVDNANNESGFRIERSADGVSFAQIDTVVADMTSWSDDFLSPSSTYYYRVRAFNGYADSAYSAMDSTTTPAGPPAAPGGLTATAGNAQVSLSWSGSPGASGYIVKRSTTIGGPYSNLGTNAATSYVDSGLANLTPYFYVVSAISALGESGDSGEVSATPMVKIQINAGGPATGSYQADAYYSGGGTYANAGTIDTGGVTDPAPDAAYTTERNGDFSYIITGLEPGREYWTRLHFSEIHHTSAGSRVFDVSINGTEVLSSFDIYAETGARYKATVREFTVPADGSGRITIAFSTVVDNAKISAIEVLNAPEAPSIIAGPARQSVVMEGTAVFSVVAVGNPSPAYIWMKDGVELTGETGQTLTVSNAQPADRGMYSVAVFNSLGAVVSGEAALAVGSASSVPTGLFAVPGNNQVTLNWFEATGATGYLVKRAAAGGGPYETLNAASEPFYVDLTAQNDTIYYYVISAVGTGDSSNSDEVSVMPTAGDGGLTLQVEDRTTTYGGGVALENNNAGYHVSAFANFPSTGGYVQFNNVDGGTGGAAALIIRFALGNTARTGRLIVNGTASSVVFPGTGSWTTWSSISIPITLLPDESNTIRLESTGQDLANIDEITVVPTVINVGPTLEYAVSNGVLYLDWPAESSGWTLQYSSNLAEAAGWTDIVNSGETNRFEVSIDQVPWNMIYFRLMLP